jgi:hypothetical protein
MMALAGHVSKRILDHYSHVHMTAKRTGGRWIRRRDLLIAGFHSLLPSSVTFVKRTVHSLIDADNSDDYRRTASGVLLRAFWTFEQKAIDSAKAVRGLLN